MHIVEIDIYNAFNKEKPKNADGMLTCYLPEVISEVNSNRKRPAILILPGGAYGWVSPREAEPIALRYLAKGFAVFVLKYSTAPCKYPTAFLEACMAMIYIKENAARFNINEKKVAALGFSAGGHLCGCLATLFEDNVAQEYLGNKLDKVRPNAVILSYPVITSKSKAHSGSFDNLCGDNKELRGYLSLEDRVTPNSSLAFIWHTYEDNAVPVYNSLAMAQAYEKNGVPFSLHIFEKGQHGLSTADSASYITDNIPEVSKGLTKWIELSIDWLEDQKIKVED